MENKMEKIAEMFGVKLREKVTIIDSATGVPVQGNPYTFYPFGLCHTHSSKGDDEVLTRLITGTYKIKKVSLSSKEKDYLETVIHPFADVVTSISKLKCVYGYYIVIYYEENGASDKMPFPCFRKEEMYKGMQVNKEYTLEELGLFKGGK